MTSQRCNIWRRIMKKRLLGLILPLLLLLGGCSSNSGIPLLGYNWWGGTPETVTVRRGDTLYSISRRYNVPLREIIEANKMIPPYRVYVGQVLRMPSARYHVVAKGDTLYNISKRYNVDMSSLSRANDLEEPYALSIGQRLLLPGSVVDSSTAISTPKATATSKPAAKKTSTSSWWSSRKKETVKKASYTLPAPVKKRKNKFMWPVKGKVISNFGSIGKGRNNDGINIKAALGTAVKCADAGTVAYAGNELKGFGNLILVKHNDGWITAYAHNDKILVKKGQKVRRGEKIATVGSTGGVNSPQLHFEIRAGKKAVNPRSYLQ